MIWLLSRAIGLVVCGATYAAVGLTGLALLAGACCAVLLLCPVLTGRGWDGDSSAPTLWLARQGAPLRRLLGRHPL